MIFRNKKAAIPLIWIVISIAAFIFIFGMVSQGYTQFMGNNNGTIDSTYLQHYSDIYNKSAGLETDASSVWTTVKVFSYAITAGIFSGINLLADTILTLANGAMLSTEILDMLKDIFPGSDILIAFLTFACTAYIAYKLIQLYRGQQQEI
jgi:hypothetical protein